MYIYNVYWAWGREWPRRRSAARPRYYNNICIYIT